MEIMGLTRKAKRTWTFGTDPGHRTPYWQSLWPGIRPKLIATQADKDILSAQTTLKKNVYKVRVYGHARGTEENLTCYYCDACLTKQVLHFALNSFPQCSVSNVWGREHHNQWPWKQGNNTPNCGSKHAWRGFGRMANSARRVGGLLLTLTLSLTWP